MKIGEHQALITTETKEHHRIAGEEHRQVTEGRGSAGWPTEGISELTLTILGLVDEDSGWNILVEKIIYFKF